MKNSSGLPDTSPLHNPIAVPVRLDSRLNPDSEIGDEADERWRVRVAMSGRYMRVTTGETQTGRAIIENWMTTGRVSGYPGKREPCRFGV